MPTATVRKDPSLSNTHHIGIAAEIQLPVLPVLQQMWTVLGERVHFVVWELLRSVIYRTVTLEVSFHIANVVPDALLWSFVH